MLEEKKTVTENIYKRKNTKQVFTKEVLDNYNGKALLKLTTKIITLANGQREFRRRRSCLDATYVYNL